MCWQCYEFSFWIDCEMFQRFWNSFTTEIYLTNQNRDQNLKTHLSSRPLTLICCESRLSAVTVQTSLREYDKLMLILVFFDRKFINNSPIFPVKSLKNVQFIIYEFLRHPFRIDSSILMNCIILIIFQF